ncbi:MAG: flavodoxin family protein [Candidatus Bathyarchaeota archaeon]|jgi:multimeric flavodoxin WrbA
MSDVKVLGVMGSPRSERNTAKLLEVALKAAEESGADIEVLSLADVDILPCTGCNTCIRERRCSQDGEDDMPSVKERLLDADGLILAAPSYFGGVPGVMKNMMDRSRSLKMDDHKLRDRVVSVLSLSGLRYGEAEQVADQLVRFGLMHGMVVVGGVGDPVSGGYFGIASLQGDEGWRRAEEDEIAMENARGVGRRVAEIAWVISGRTEQ